MNEEELEPYRVITDLYDACAYPYDPYHWEWRVVDKASGIIQWSGRKRYGTKEDAIRAMEVYLRSFYRLPVHKEEKR
jgi:hypothetical protein